MFQSLFPVFSLIFLGALLRWVGFPGKDFWRGAENLTYNLLFPSLLFLKLSSSQVGTTEIQNVALVVVGTLLITTLLLLVIGRVLGEGGARFTSFYQGGIRFNTYVGLASVNELFGGEGMAVAALILGLMIPLVNLLCIWIFELNVPVGKRSLRTMLINVLKNPLIIACVVGFSWNRLGLPLPQTIESVLLLLAGTALPLGLLAVGAGIYLDALRGIGSTFFASSAVKLLVVPALFYMISRMFGLDEITTLVLVVMGSLPTASSAYILARQLGGDGPTMAAIISGQTLLAMLTMPLVLGLVT